MPPIKKYDSAFPPAPCKAEAKKALETAADAVSEIVGKTVKTSALERQIVVDWLISNGFYTDEPSETEDLQEFKQSSIELPTE